MCIFFFFYVFLTNPVRGVPPLQDKARLGSCLALVDAINEGTLALPNLPSGLIKKVRAHCESRNL